jgi:hypothetical protein
MLPRSREHCRGRRITLHWYLTCGAARNASNGIFVGLIYPRQIWGAFKAEGWLHKAGFLAHPVAGVLVLNAETRSRGSRTGTREARTTTCNGRPSRSNTLSGPAETCKITAGNYRLGHVRIAGHGTDEEVEGDGCRSFNKLNTYKSRWWGGSWSVQVPAAPDLIQRFNTQADTAPVHECQMNMPYSHRGRLVSSREIATQASAHPNHGQPWYQAN